MPDRITRDDIARLLMEPGAAQAAQNDMGTRRYITRMLKRREKHDD